MYWDGNFSVVCNACPFRYIVTANIQWHRESLDISFRAFYPALSPFSSPSFFGPNNQRTKEKEALKFLTTTKQDFSNTFQLIYYACIINFTYIW